MHSAHNTDEIPGELVRSEGDPPTSDAAVDEAFDGLGSTFDLMHEIFGRNSLDDAGTLEVPGSDHDAIWARLSP